MSERDSRPQMQTPSRAARYWSYGTEAMRARAVKARGARPMEVTWMDAYEVARRARVLPDQFASRLPERRVASLRLIAAGWRARRVGDRAGRGTG